MYALWLSVINLANFVNFIIWHDNVKIIAPVWCDIGEWCPFDVLTTFSCKFVVTKIQVGIPLGIRACTLVLCMRLYSISRMKKSLLADTRSEVRVKLSLRL